jgi:hypothetical protein
MAAKTAALRKLLAEEAFIHLPPMTPLAAG